MGDRFLTNYQYTFLRVMPHRKKLGVSEKTDADSGYRGHEKCRHLVQIFTTVHESNAKRKSNLVHWKYVCYHLSHLELKRARINLLISTKPLTKRLRWVVSVTLRGS